MNTALTSDMRRPRKTLTYLLYSDATAGLVANIVFVYDRISANWPQPLARLAYRS